ncbi:MAG: DUF3122 domain-containing protein [Xenococcaceae cyanobacterium]
MRQSKINTWCRIRQFFSWLLLAGVLVLLILIGLGSFTTPPAAASIRQMEEAPGQMLYQSRHTLRDDGGNSWQVVLFKRVKPDGSTSVNLRLVDFPGTAEFAHPQPLTITTNIGEVFKAEDMFATKAPAANVGQYDIKDILPRLPTDLPVRLLLPLKSNQSVEMQVPSVVVLEWQTVAGEG